MNPEFTESVLAAADLRGTALGFSRSSLAPVWQLNRYFLETLSDCARHPAWCGSSWETALGRQLAYAVPPLREELAQSPVSLVCIAPGSGGSGSLLTEIDERRTHSPPDFLARDRAVQLAQLTLTLAWTVARIDLVSTAIVFGFSQRQAQEIGGLSVQEIPAVAKKLCGTLQPRWLLQPRIWRHLLRYSDRSPTSHLPPIYVRTLQRQFADLSPATCTRVHHLTPGRNGVGCNDSG